MNTRSLLVVLAILGVMSIALTSRSTLTPKRGGDHVFYGAEVNHFISEEAAVGNFNGDQYDDIVTTIKWDNPAAGDAPKDTFTTDFACDEIPSIQKVVWDSFLVAQGAETLRVCDFPGEYGDRHRREWQDLGWDSLAVGDCDECYLDVLTEGLADALCDTCYALNLRGEDQGAALVFLGGDWSGKGHDVDLASGGADLVVLGRVAGGDIYNAMAVGDMDDDGMSELVLGAPHAGAGEVYVIRGSDAWPDTIDLDNSEHFRDWVLHYIVGRDAGDEFGLGVAMGDLDGDIDGLMDLVVVAPGGDSYTGEAFVFYSAAGIPDSVDLSQESDNDIDGYAQAIYGATMEDSLGVTSLENTHAPHHGYGSHTGGYQPVGLALGDWDGNGVDDLAIGAGHAGARVGAAYVIFGAGSPLKLTPGNTIDLGNTPGISANACDIRIDGSGGMALGGGLGFVDADAGNGKDDLMIGAPTASGGGKLQRGSVFLIFGDTKANLMSLNSGVRVVSNSAHTDAIIFGEDANDQLGAHFSGGTNVKTLDIDNDGDNDIGIAGQKEMTVIFGQSAWEAEIDLANVLDTYPDMRIIEFQAEQYARSTTILLADLDGDDHHDLVFGGYDSPGYSPGDPTGETGVRHAGQMWVAKGHDLWKSGAISANTTWSGNVFVHGDLVVEDGVTLTIAAGTDVWIWPKDPDSSDDVWPSYPLHFDTTRVEFRVYGNLVVNGTSGEDEEVRFLGWTMDGAVSEEPDLWWGIHVHDGSATFNYCEIRNAVNGIQANVDITVKNSTIADCDNLGLSSASADSIYVENTTISNIGWSGINLLGGTRLRFKNSTVEDVADYGALVYSGAKLYADGSTFDSAGMYGVYVNPGDSTTAEADLDDCMFTNNDVGLFVDGVPDVVVANSVFDENDTNGIYCVDGADIDIADNTITDSATGVECVDYSHATITGNLIRDHAVGLYCDENSDPLVEGNDIIFNTVCVTAVNDAEPDLGNGAQSSAGDNEVHHGTSHFVVNLSGGITIMAENNFWNNGTSPYQPNPSKISGSVDTSPAVGSAPSPVAPAPTPVTVDLPKVYALSPNYPNPFNPTTTIRYEVPPPGGLVKIAIYDVRGQLVRTLVNAKQVPGYYSEVWDGTSVQGGSVSSGIYFLQMRAGAFVKSHKLVLLK